MIDKLKEVQKKFDDIATILELPETISDQVKYKALMKEYKQLTPIIEKFREYTSAVNTMDELYIIMNSESDAEMRSLASEEYYEIKDLLPQIEEDLKILLLPPDPNDDKSVIVEIRAGAGGDEAALFANSLHRMYNLYSAARKYKYELISINETGLGGLKEVSFLIDGEGAYSRFKFESGVHRVQRVPETESGGRIHTSTVTVAVLLEVSDIEIEVKDTDIIIESCKSSGAGGQHVNKTESAVRLTHKPSGIVIECQEERSQKQNKEKALRLLRSKLYDIELTKQTNAIASERRSQVGTGDRSERIRTYNYPQGRVTDHRIGMTIYELENFLCGSLDRMIDALAAADAAERLKN